MNNPYETDQQVASAPLTPYAAPSYSVPTGQYGSRPQPNFQIPAQSPASKNVPTLGGLLHALKRRWVLAGFLGLLVGAAAAMTVMVAFPQGKHQVKALLEVQPNNVNVIPGANQQQDNLENYKANQTLLIKTRTLMQRVAQNEKVSKLSIVTQMEDPAKSIDDMVRPRWDSDILAVTMNGDKPDELKVILDVLVNTFVTDNSETLLKERQNRKDMYVKVRDDYLRKASTRC
jgi:polysaccharide biosynthesis transport protein